MCLVGWLIMTMLQNGSFWLVVGSYCPLQTDEYNHHTWIMILIVIHNINMTNFSFNVTLITFPSNYVELTSRFLTNLINIAQNTNLYLLGFFLQSIFYFRYKKHLNSVNICYWNKYILILMLMLSKCQILLQFSWYLNFSYTARFIWCVIDKQVFGFQRFFCILWFLMFHILHP